MLRTDKNDTTLAQFTQVGFILIYKPAIYMFNRSIHPSMSISFDTMAEFQRNDKQLSYILSIYTEYTKFLTESSNCQKPLKHIYTYVLFLIQPSSPVSL